MSGDSVIHVKAGDEIENRKSGNAFAPDRSGQPNPRHGCSGKSVGGNEKQQSQENSEIFVNFKKLHLTSLFGI